MYPDDCSARLDRTARWAADLRDDYATPSADAYGLADRPGTIRRPLTARSL